MAETLSNEIMSHADGTILYPLSLAEFNDITTPDTEDKCDIWAF